MSNIDLINKITQNFNNFLFKNKKISIEDSILIVGSPRSGTTWLMDILCSLPGYTSVFEPLNPIWYPESFEVGFRSRTFLKSDKIWPERKEYLEKIFTGKIANLPIKDTPLDLLNTISINNLFNYIFGSKLIIKSVNMNRMLPWVIKNFPLKNIFYIIRHPCATISSQLRTGLYGYRNSSPPYHDIFPNIQDIKKEISELDNLDFDLISKLKDLKKREEVLAFIWGLDNYIPLSFEKPYPWKTIIYEKLVMDGKKEIKKIFDDMGVKNIPKSTFHYLKKPSAVTLKEDKKYIKRPEYQISKWKKFLSEQQIKNIMKIVSYFNIDFYSEDFEPKNNKFF